MKLADRLLLALILIRLLLGSAQIIGRCSPGHYFGKCDGRFNS